MAEGTKRKCPKCGGELRILLPPLQFGDPGHPQVTRPLRFRCQDCSLEFTAAELHGDFWGHVLAFINEADEDCTKMFKAGKLEEFEKDWLDPADGRIARLEAYAWFEDAKPVAKQIATKSIRDYVQNTVDYYRYLVEELAADL
jgi:hypothetical protein